MNGQFYKPAGFTLVVVLLFAAILAILCQVALQTSGLQIKMINHTQIRWRQHSLEQQAIAKLEQQLQDFWWTLPPKGATHLQNVKDSLQYGDKNGIQFFQVAHGSIATTHASRTSTFEFPRRFPAVAIPEHTHASFAFWFPYQSAWLAVFVVYDHPRAYLTFIDPHTQQTIQQQQLALQENSQQNWPYLCDIGGQEQADLLYLSDARSSVWKFALSNIHALAVYHPDCQFDGEIEQMLVGPGRKPQTHLIYLLINQAGRKQIVALEDNLVSERVNCQAIRFKIEQADLFAGIKLWQGTLITNTRTHILRFDATTGALLQKHAITQFWPEALNSPQQSPIILTQKPLEAKRVVRVALPNGCGQSEIDIDGDKLGRRTFRSQA